MNVLTKKVAGGEKFLMVRYPRSCRLTPHILKANLMELTRLPPEPTPLKKDHIRRGLVGKRISVGMGWTREVTGGEYSQDVSFTCMGMP